MRQSFYKIVCVILTFLPQFLLADEPTGNLDSDMARSVLDLLQEINQKGTTIVMVTHDHALANLAQRSIQVLDGKVLV